MLTHYVIVRRDLPVDVTCAQIVHAAGESVALYAGSSVLEHRTSSPEVGGLIPSQRAIYGGGVAEGDSPAGVNPASRAILPPDTVAVVLSVRNESRLLAAARRLSTYGVAHCLVRDADLGNMATAIGVVPCDRQAVGRALKDCIMFRPSAPPEIG